MLVMDSIDSFTFTGRRVEAAEPPSPTVEDCYRNLVAAILLQAKKDLAEPGYRAHAVRWLHSNGARVYAEMLGIEPSAVTNLVRPRGGR